MKLSRPTRQRKLLFHMQGGKCHWCKQQMVFYIPKNGEKPLANMVTIDHLDDRLNPHRGKTGGSVRRRVGACWQCNVDRGSQSVAAQPIEVLWQRSGRLPLAVRLETEKVPPQTSVIK